MIGPGGAKGEGLSPKEESREKNERLEVAQEIVSFVEQSLGIEITEEMKIVGERIAEAIMSGEQPSEAIDSLYGLFKTSAENMKGDYHELEAWNLLEASFYLRGGDNRAALDRIECASLMAWNKASRKDEDGHIDSEKLSLDIDNLGDKVARLA